MVKINYLDGLANPKDAGREQLGLAMGTFKGPILLGEDAIVFGDKHLYSLVTKSKCLVFELAASQVSLPVDCFNAMKVQSIDKYNSINDQLLKTEQFFAEDSTKKQIWMAG